MADLAAALTALHDLQSDDVDVIDEGDKARIVVRHLDTSSTGSPSKEKASYEFTVDFDAAAGEYRLSSTERSSESGATGTGFSLQKNSGSSKSFSFTSSTGPGGSVTNSFDSSSWEESIRSRVEAAGWTRRKGLLGKLFGR